MRVDIRTAAGLLKAHDNILFICHSNPDGDTIGSAFALCGALDRLGKKCRVSCYDRIPAMYSLYIMPFSLAISCVISMGKPKVSYRRKATRPGMTILGFF